MTCFPHIYAYGQQKKQQFSEAEVLLFYCLCVHFRQPAGCWPYLPPCGISMGQ